MNQNVYTKTGSRRRKKAVNSLEFAFIIPLQHLLALGSEARLNRPSTATGNWRWRYTQEMLTPDVQERLKRLTVMYGR